VDESYEVHVIRPVANWYGTWPAHHKRKADQPQHVHMARFATHVCTAIM
jgi:hypothetical protein